MAITITSSGTYTVIPGETYIIDPSVSGDVKFVWDGHDPTPVDFNIELNESPTHTSDVKIITYSDGLSPTVTIADNYDGPKTEFDLKKAIDTEIISGENVVIDHLEASEIGQDVATFESLDRLELMELGYLELDGNKQDEHDPSSLDCLNFGTGWMTDAERAELEQALIAAGYQSDGSGGWVLPSGVYDAKVELQMDLDGDGHDDFTLKLHHWEKVNTVVVTGPDGAVDGEETGELMELGYDDSNAPTDQGGDIITNDADLIFGNGGNDTIDGAGGDDTIYGDSGVFQGARESFNWDLVTSVEADTTVTQDTGSVQVTYTRTVDSGSHESDVDNATPLNTAGIDTGGEAIDTNSALRSETNGQGSVGKFQWEFDAPVGNVDFNINDLDGDGIVTVTAFDALGNPVGVVLVGGSDISVSGNVADAQGPYQDPNDPDTTVQVSIAGPVSKIVVEHTQDGANNSGIWITDMYFDTGSAFGASVGGDDVISGGTGADMIYGEGGNDTLLGEDGSDVLDGGSGDDSIDGGADNDTIIASAGNDTIDGGDGTDTYVAPDGPAADPDIGSTGDEPARSGNIQDITLAEDDGDGSSGDGDAGSTVEVYYSGGLISKIDLNDDNAGGAGEDVRITDNGTGDFESGYIDFKFPGGGGGDNTGDVARFDLSTFDDDFAIEVKSEDLSSADGDNDPFDNDGPNQDVIVLEDVTSITDNGDGTVTVDYIGRDGLPHTMDIAYNGARIEAYGPGGDPITSTIEVTVDNNGDGTVENVTEGTTDTVTSVEDFVAGESPDEADVITLTDPVDVGDATTAIELDDTAVGTFLAQGGTPGVDEIAFGGPGQPTINEILAGTYDPGTGPVSPIGEYQVTSGDETGRVADITFANFETINFTVADVSLLGPVDGTDDAQVMLPGFTDLQGDQIDGTDGDDDTIYGNAGDDTIDGGAGNDTIDGGADDDSITGGVGDDSVLGGVGSDTLAGGAGTDTLLGGDGDDDIAVGGDDSAEGGIGDDEFTVDATDPAADFNATIDGGSDGTQPGDEAGSENGDEGDILNLSDQGNDLTVDLTGNSDPESGTVDGLDGDGTPDITFEEIERIITGSGNDTVDASGTTGPIDVTTGSGDDSVDGSDGDDVVDAGPGNDTVNGGDGSDTVDGGDGDNLIDTRGNVYLDPISGGEISGTPDLGYPGLFAADPDPDDDKDVVTTGSGNDTITTGDDADVINAGDGDNDIDGGLDNDTITAGSGNDLIVGGEGSDSIVSGDGNDTIYAGNDPSVPDAVNIPDADVGGLSPDLVPENGKDFVDAGAGNDVVFGADDDDTILGGTGNDILDGGIDDDSIEGGEGIDIIIGGQGDDTLLGGDDTDLIVGGDDNDSILGGDGVDILDGEAGDDFVDGGAQTDLILGEDGEDTLIGADGGDLVLGGTENDLIYGDDTLNDGNNAGGAADILFGEDGDDTIIGGAGNDTIDGGNGADSMSGGDDRDTFIEVGPGDVIDGGEGGDDFDTIILSGPAIIDYDPTNPENGTITFIDLATQTPIGTATFTNIEDVTFVQPEANPPLVENDENTDPNTDPLSVIIDYNPPETPDAAPPPPAGAPEGHVDGTSGDDIMGFNPIPYVDVDGDAMDSGDAILTGEVGDDDIVRAYGGNDTIFSGLGNDEVFAGEGDDQVQAGVGNDLVRGQDGNDTLAGGEGSDRIRGDEGNDLIFGQEDNDQLEGGNGDDTLDGGTENDILLGGAGNDSVVGGTGNDLLFGEAGNDTLDGGGDSDLDRALGGDDEDLFVGFGAGDTIDGGSGGVDNDTLDLSGSGPFVVVADDGVTPLDLSAPNDPDGNSFSGKVNFLDAGGNVTGTLSFSEIENIIPCFTPGTVIATPKGERLVEELREGDKIITRDNGLQEIRWVGRRDLTGRELVGAPHLRPVLIRAGSLGHGLPERDMMVSPQHRILINNDRSALYFDDREVLAAAKHLTAMEGVDSVEASSISYIHFMFDQHEVVLSNGAWTESFQPGETVLDAMGKAQRSEIFELFPELAEKDGLESYTSARRSLKKHEALLLVS